MFGSPWCKSRVARGGRRASLARREEGEHRLYSTDDKVVGHGFSRAIAGLKACATPDGMQRRSNAAALSSRAAIGGTKVKCPFCGHLSDKVVDSRESKEGAVIRRRRECQDCGRRFTSYERIDEIPYMVVKKDGSRERFERQKVTTGMLKACEKRPVTVAAVEAIADRVEAMLQERPEKEIPTDEVGAFLMQELKQLDKVAYVRFASVYRHFRDIGEFMTELRDLLDTKE